MKNFVKSILLVLIIIAPHFSIGQVMFEKVYGGNGYDYGYSVVQTYDKGYVVAGSTTSFGFGNTDAYILKTDSMGVPLWHKTFGGINIDQSYSIQETNDSGLVIAGYTNSFGNGGYDMYVIKTNKYGNTIWTKTYGGSDWDLAYSIKQTNDGGYIIAGGTYSFGNGNEDMYLVKINSVGDTLWTKTYGGINEDEAKSVKQTSDGGYILTGFTKSYGDINGDMYTIKTNSLGDTLWTFKSDAGSEDKSFDVIEDNSASGNYIVVGESITSFKALEGISIGLNSTGSQTSYSYWGFPGASCEDVINSITQSTTGKFLMAGYTNYFGTDDFLFYYSKPIHNFIDGGNFGGTNTDRSYCVNPTKDGGYIFCGNSLSYSNLDHIFLVKTDSNGVAPITATVVITDINNLTILTKNGFELYPNPANNNIHLALKTTNDDEFIVTLSDIIGRKYFIKKIKAINNSDLNLEFATSDLENGIYFMSLQNKNSVQTKQFIISH